MGWESNELMAWGVLQEVDSDIGLLEFDYD